MKKWKNIFFFSGFTFAISILVIFLLIQLWILFLLTPFTGAFIKKGIRNATDSLYYITYGKLGFNLPERALVLTDVSFDLDTALYRQRKSDSVHIPNIQFQIHFAELRITGISVYEAFKNRDLVLENFIIETPSVNLTLTEKIKKIDTLEKKPIDFDLYKLFSETFNLLSVKKILVQDGIFQLFNNVQNTAPSVSSSGIRLEVNNLVIDSAYSNNRYETNLASKINISVEEAHWFIPGNIYRLQFSKMNLDAIQQSLSFAQVQLIPLVDKYKLSGVLGHQADLIDLDVHPLELHRLDINSLIYQRSIVCGKVLMQDFSIHAFRYKNGIIRNDTLLLPMEQLRLAPFTLRIDSLIVSNGIIEYGEQSPERKFPGFIRFTQLNGLVTNISNDSSSLAFNPVCTVTGDCRLMDKAKLNAIVQFNQLSPRDSFRFHGTLGSIPLKLFSPLVFQSVDAKISHGKLDGLTFSAEGSSLSAWGNMTLLYHDLYIRVLSKSENVKTNNRTVISILANAFLLDSANPKNGITRKVKLHARRQPDKYIINYFWKIIYSGIEETILSETARKKQLHLENNY